MAGARIEAALAPIVRTLNVQIAHNNLATARAMHGAELADKAYGEFDKSLPTLHQSEIASILRAPNPFVAARRHQLDEAPRGSR